VSDNPRVFRISFKEAAEIPFLNMYTILQALFSLGLAVPLVPAQDTFGPDIKTHSIKFDRKLNTATATSKEINLLDAQEIALAYLSSKNFVKDQNLDLKITSMYQSNNLFLVYFVQLYKDLEIVNAVGNVNVMDNGDLLSASHSFFAKSNTLKMKNIRHADATILPSEKALYSFLAKMGIADQYSVKTIDEKLVLEKGKTTIVVPHVMKYIQTESQLRLCHDFEIDLGDNWYNSQIDAETGETIQVVDWVSKATFNVFPWGSNDPTEGDRELLVNPEHLESSPWGWNTFNSKKDGKVLSTATSGNNVYAQGICF
jgi:hypothetical protein